MCFKSRTCPVTCIYILSVLAAIAGLCMIIFSFLLTSSEFVEKIGEADSFDDIEDGQKFIFTVLVIFSITTIVIAGCGFCFKCCNNRCFAGMYGCILLPTWLLVIVVGGVATGLSLGAKDQIEEVCNDFGNQISVNLADGGASLNLGNSQASIDLLGGLANI